MKRKTKSVIFGLSLLLYGLVLTAVLLYVRFPADKAEKYLSVKMAEMTAGADITVGSCGYVLPAGLRCDRIHVSSGEDDREIAVLENVAVVPLLVGLGLKYRMSGEIYSGMFSSVVGFAPLDASVTVSGLELTNLDLGRLPLVQHGLQRQVTGLLDFRGSWSVNFKDEAKGNVEGKVTVRDGDFSLRQPIFMAERMEMAPLEVGIDYGNGVVRLSDGHLGGTRFESDFSGEIQVRETIASWNVELQGRLTPTRSYVDSNLRVQRLARRLQREYENDRLPFRVSGSLAAPRFRFGTQ